MKPLNKDINEIQNKAYYEIARVVTNDYGLAAQLHGTVTISHQYGNRLKFPLVQRTPNASYVMAYIQTWDSSSISIGYYNMADVAVTGGFDVLLFLK